MGAVYAKLKDDVAWYLLHATFFDVNFMRNQTYLRAFIIHILLMMNLLVTTYVLRNCPGVMRCMEEDYWPIIKKLICGTFIRCLQLLCWQKTVLSPLGFSLLFGSAYYPSILLLQTHDEIVFKALTTTAFNMLFINALALTQDRSVAPFAAILVACGFGMVFSSFLCKFLMDGSWFKGSVINYGIILITYGIYFAHLVHLKHNVHQRLNPGQNLSRIPSTSCLLYGLTLIIIFLQINGIMDITPN